MLGPRFFVIIPTFSHFDYADRCVRSLMACDADVFCMIVDDASRDWTTAGEPLMRRYAAEFPDRVAAAIFPQNGGLTRSWNLGLRMARDGGADIAVCGNSDLVFSKNSLAALAAAIETDQADLVGPVSNAPGKTCPDVQGVEHYLHDYKPSDDPDAIESTAAALHKSFAGRCKPVKGVNGFCMAAKTGVWWANAYDADHVFRPTNPKTSDGRPNPTPLMTLNEDELQGRWRANGLRSGVVPAAYVLHYRAVSRGERYKAGQWLRMKGGRNEVA